MNRTTNEKLRELSELREKDGRVNRKRGNFEPETLGYITATGELIKVKREKDGGFTQLREDRGELIFALSLGCLTLAILVAGIAFSLYHR